MMLQLVLNGGFECADAFEDAATIARLGQQGEEALDLIEPGRRGGRAYENGDAWRATS